MNSKVQEKQRAVELRRQGSSYGDILKEVRVAKSTLSNWLKDLPLTKEERVYLKKRKDSNINRGRIKAAAAHRRNRMQKEQMWYKEAKQEFEAHKENSFFQVGLALYWAEGAKRDSVCSFMNSDYKMAQVFVRWVEKFARISREGLIIRLYIHQPYAHENCEAFWAERLDIPVDQLRQTIYKPSGKQIKKRPQYKGCLRVIVPKSTKLLYKLKVWQNMLAKQYNN